jgi:hypothetical protein
MKYVFDTDNLKRYVFPTHINDIVVDRKDASTSEVLTFPHLLCHYDLE